MCLFCVDLHAVQNVFLESFLESEVVLTDDRLTVSWLTHKKILLFGTRDSESLMHGLSLSCIIDRYSLSTSKGQN